MARTPQDYERLVDVVKGSGDVQERMRRVVDALWDTLHSRGFSWVGFYLDQPDKPTDRRLVLGPCRDTPACSPISLHGVCGQALLTRRTQIVGDVRSLAGYYITFDPQARSELVVPLVDAQSVCWGVLDVESHEKDAFELLDDTGLRLVLRAADLLAE